MRRLALAGAALVGVALTFVAPAAVAAASGARADPAPCTVITRTDTVADIQNETGGGPPPKVGAVLSLENQGIRMGTPTDQNQSTFLVAPPISNPLNPVLLSAVTKISYQTQKFDSSNLLILPAYKIEILLEIGDMDADLDFATLVFEPYRQGPGNPPAALTTWTPDLLSADTKVWLSRALASPVLPAQSLISWPALIAAHPEAVVLRYGAGVGSVNAVADTKFDTVRFEYGDSKIGDKPTNPAACREHIWRKSVTSTPTPAPPAAPTATGPLGGVTGTDVTWIVASGAGLLAFGVLLAVVTRRRRSA